MTDILTIMTDEYTLLLKWYVIAGNGSAHRVTSDLKMATWMAIVSLENAICTF